MWNGNKLKLNDLSRYLEYSSIVKIDVYLVWKFSILVYMYDYDETWKWEVCYQKISLCIHRN